MLKKLTLLIAFASAFAVTTHAATIAWGAGQYNGFSKFNAAELPIGNLVRLGNFSLTDGQITAFFNAGNIASLNANFVEVATAKIGDGAGAPSNFAASSAPDTTAVAGLQMYYWAYASTDNTSTTTSKNSAFEVSGL